MICENHILTDEQVQHYETFGFIIRRQLFDFKEIERINDEFENFGNFGENNAQEKDD